MRISDWSSDVCSSDLDARDWQRQIKESSGHDARLYLQARATSQVAVDPIDLQLTGPRRTAIELIEYLWKRKFCKAAAQCNGRSEERRVGHECFSTCRSRGSPYL